LATVVVALVIAVLVTKALRNGPDPGGRRLTSLEALVAGIARAADAHVPWVIAVPSPPTANYAWGQEPSQDSCDSIPGTKRWDPIIVDVNFQWRHSAKGITTRFNHELASAGFAKTNWIPSWDSDLGGSRASAVGVWAWIRTVEGIGPEVLTLTAPSHDYQLLATSLPEPGVGVGCADCRPERHMHNGQMSDSRRPVGPHHRVVQ
jgi:hypothetical protein